MIELREFVFEQMGEDGFGILKLVVGGVQAHEAIKIVQAALDGAAAASDGAPVRAQEEVPLDAGSGRPRAEMAMSAVDPVPKPKRAKKDKSESDPRQEPLPAVGGAIVGEPAKTPETSPVAQEEKKGWNLSGKGSDKDDDIPFGSKSSDEPRPINPPPAFAPTAASGVLGPPTADDLKKMVKFGEVLQRMIDARVDGKPVYKSVAAIADACESFKGQVPVIDRLPDVRDRVMRAMGVIQHDLPME